jgi:hypothetical protein
VFFRDSESPLNFGENLFYLDFFLSKRLIKNNKKRKNKEARLRNGALALHALENRESSLFMEQ